MSAQIAGPFVWPGETRRLSDGRLALVIPGGSDGSSTPTGITGGTAGRIIRDNGTTGAWTTATYPTTVSAGGILYASSSNTVGALAAGSAGKIIRSDGTVPAYSTFTIADTYARGDILRAGTANNVTALTVGSAGKVIRSDGTDPQWSTYTISDTYARGDILRASAANTVTALTIGAANRVLTSDGTDPVWSTSLSLTGGLTLTKTAVMATFNTGAATDGRWEFQYNSGRIGFINMASATALRYATDSGVDMVFYAGNTSSTVPRLTLKENGDVVLGDAALATNATVKFPFIPTCAGAPTGTPAGSYTGRVAMVFDTTNNKLMIYDGGWIGVTLA